MSNTQLTKISFLTALLVCTAGFARCDTIQMKYTGQTFKGKITSETAENITVKLTTGGTTTVPKSCINKIKIEEIPEKELYTDVDIYFKKASQIDPKNAEANLKLAEWCLEHSTTENRLSEMAIMHLNLAKELKPDIIAEVPKKLQEAEDKEAKKIYDAVETYYNNAQYLGMEKVVFSLIYNYPKSLYTDKAKDLLVKVWGSQLANKILSTKDGLPDIVFFQEDLKSILSHMDSQEKKEKYFTKCLDKGTDFEERGDEVGREKREGYYFNAINCYGVVLNAEKPELKNLALSKQQGLLKRYFDDVPLPSSEERNTVIKNLISSIKDEDLAGKVASKYFDKGNELYKKAKKLKQPEKTETATLAYYCYSIANIFSKNDKIKQGAYNGMFDCQRLQKPAKK